jgi:XTP/dITP diphosphohydrolase
MTVLILATNNPDKIREIEKILADVEVEIRTMADFDDFPNVEETGKTIAENAVLKAEAVWKKYGLPCVADDTGLEVDCLDGAPGVYSSRFAGEDCSYEDNWRKLLSLLEGVQDKDRAARFRTVITFVDKDGQTHVAEGMLEGSIARQPRGEFGFGYDPVFIVADTEKTLAELPPQEKNRISHRGLALRNVKPVILESLR